MTGKPLRDDDHGRAVGELPDDPLAAPAPPTNPLTSSPENEHTPGSPAAPDPEDGVAPEAWGPHVR